MKIPEGHQAVMPYLMLHNADQFIGFATDVFGAVLRSKRMREDGAGMMHAEVAIGGCVIMFSDASEQWPAQTANLFVYVDDADTAFQKALDAGATVIMELSDQDYGRTCGIKDTTGNTWWITAVQ